MTESVLETSRALPNVCTCLGECTGRVLLTLLRLREQNPEESQGGAVGKDGAKLCVPPEPTLLANGNWVRDSVLVHAALQKAAAPCRLFPLFWELKTGFC